MARLRTVKPEYWTDEMVGQCSIAARLLFVGTWNFADDHGGLARSAKQLKAQVFPYDNIDCEPLIQELLDAGLLIEYEAEGKKYLHIRGFKKHQKVEKPAAPRVPLYEEKATTRRGLPEDSPKPQESSPESSGSSLGSFSLGIGAESSGVESTRGAGPAPPTPAGKQPTPEAQMAIALRDLGVTVTSIDPVLIAWVKDGYTVQQASDAVGIARIRKPHPEPIHPNYIDPILRQPARAPPANGARRSQGAWDRMMEANGGE